MIFVNDYRFKHHSILINEDQFRGFLTCHTSLAKFEIDGNTWVVRYMQNYPGHNLQFASEFVGYRIAQILEAPILEFNVLTIDKPFKKSGIEVLSGPATACKWVEDVYHLDVEKAPLDEFWEKEYYLKIVATIRTLDTWIMNFDRRKDGNMVFTGPKEAPKIWILDFDKSFLEKYRSPNCARRLHWSEEEFSKEALDDSEVLSGFDGTPLCHNK